MNCPVCGAEATITEGRYFSLFDGGELRDDEIGHGRGWAWSRENDYVTFSCGPGFMMWIDENGAPQKRHLTEDER